MRPTAALLGALLIFGGPAAAEGPDAATSVPACPAAARPPRGLEAWPGRIDVPAAERPAGLAEAALRPGQAANVALHPVDRVSFPSQPPKPGASGSYGGLLTVEIVQPGAYRVALGEAAWVDLFADGRPLVSTAHGHGAPCSGVRKVVDFVLPRGTHLIQISASPAPRIAILVARATDAP